jgi:multidrug resistance protein, MATE family
MHTHSHMKPPVLDGARGPGLMTGMWPLALPIIFAELGETVTEVTDTMFLAHVGTTELAAIGVADTVYDLFRIAIIGLVDAIQIVTARRVGQRRDTAVGAAFNQGLVLLVVLSLVLAAALKISSPYLMVAALSSENLAVTVDAFLQIIAFGLVFHSANIALSALLVSLGCTRALIGATLVMALTNFVVGYCLIFGVFGLPALGIQGAAIGSIVAELAAFIYLMVHTLRHVDIRRYALFQWPRMNVRTMRLLGRISWPVALDAMLECLRWLAFFLILEQVSEEALALSNIVFAAFGLLLIPSEAFSEVANSRVSVLIGADEGDRIGALTRRLIALSLLVTLPFVVLVFLFPGPLLSLFLSDPEMIDTSSNGLRILALAVLIATPADTWQAAVVGTGDTLAAFVIELLMTLVMLGLAYVVALVLEWPLELIWMAVPISWLLVLGCSFFYLKAGTWQRLEI